MTSTVLESPAPTISPGTGRGLVVVYSVTAGLGSALLFLVEPMMARQLLPLLGGSAAVWNTAMVFFQCALLTGYLVAHVAHRRFGAGRRLAVVAVIAAGVVALPLTLPTWDPPTGGGQTWWVLGILAVSVGLPFVGLASLSPTLQQWFADTDHPHAGDPYFLYAAGNVGSVIGLVAYPSVVEPMLGLSGQRRWWSVAYGIALALVVACALLRRHHRRPGAAEVATADMAAGVTADMATGATVLHTTAPGWADRLRWVGLAAVPSGLLLGVTRHLSTDVAAVPLLWVLPLLAYLGTFVVAFRRGTPPSSGLLRASLLLSVPLVATMVSGIGSALVAVAIGLGGFTLLALVCHSCLAADRPGTDWITSYYLWISFGGAVGGISVALVAPVVFSRVTEYPLLVLAALVVVARTARGGRVVGAVPADSSRRSRVGTASLVALVAVTCVVIARQGPEHTDLMAQVLVVGGAVVYVVARTPRRIAGALAALVVVAIVVDGRPGLTESRTFFGVYRVSVDDDGRHVFEHGTTIHGEQEFEPAPSTRPLTYYTTDSGVGRVLTALTSDPAPLDVAVVGLGAGTLATYGRVGDHLDFYEIDGEVVRIARDPRLFTFLRDTEASVSTVVGDGRLELARSERELDLLVLDAFSSDAIPVHLLTAEAMDDYRRRLAPGGVIAVHISNRFFDLAPIVSRLGGEVGLEARRLSTSVSTWMLLSGDDAPVTVRREVDGPDWDVVTPDASVPLWTDDYSNLLSTLR